MQQYSDINYRPNVGIMLVNNEGLIFSGQRLDNPAWQMPQGGIDNGELDKDAALRELEEETGVKPTQVEIVAVSVNWLYYDLPKELLSKLWGGKYKGQKQKWFLMHFKGKDSDINIQTKVPEFSQWRWLTRNQLLASIVPFKLEVYKAVFAEFSQSDQNFKS